MERGIDVSQYQGKIDWQAVKGSGITFAIIRASVCKPGGILKVDTRFAENWAGAREAGILRGAYHYLRQEAEGQARFFVDTVGDDRPELGYWADLECSSLTLEKCEAFCAAVHRNSGERAGIYTRASFFDRFGDAPWASDHRLWVAHWGAKSPRLPWAWDTWEIWQHSDCGRVPGIKGAVDLDWRISDGNTGGNENED